MSNKRENVFQMVVVEYSKRRNGYHRNFVIADDRGLTSAPKRTIVRRFRDYRSAMKWGGRFGSVISCHKVDTYPYFRNIEYLNLTEKQVEIKIDREEYVLNRALELSHPRIEDEKYGIKVVDKEE